jgi:hypothetical protein
MIRRSFFGGTNLNEIILKSYQEKYYKLEKSKNAFDWVAKATRNNRVVAGKGYERIDGSNMRGGSHFISPT